MDKNDYKISVVIPTIGRDSLQQCRAGLEKQTLKPHEVIVVYDKDRKGPSWGRNEGIRRSTGDFVAFIDDDNVPHPEWLETFAKYLEQYQADGAGSGYAETDSLLKDIRQIKIDRRPKKVTIDNEGLVGVGGNVIFRKSILQDLINNDGFVFNPKFKVTAEDWEMVMRLRANKAKLVFVPDNNIIHLKKITSKEFMKYMYLRGKGIADLDLYQKQKALSITPHYSLLWNKDNQGPLKYVKIAVHKLIGPFNYKNFSSMKNFSLYWVGEKVKSVGFLKQRIYNKFKKTNLT